MREALKARGSRPSLVPAARPWRESWLPAAVFTAAVYFLGLAGLILVIQDHGEWAVRLALAGVIVAGLRLRFRGPSVSDQAFVEEFGALADLLCFSVLPGLLLYRLAFVQWGLLGLMGIFAVIFSGVLRLSLFKLYNPSPEKRWFVGIPLTLMAAFIGLASQLVTPNPVAGTRLVLLALVMTLAILTLSTLRYPKSAESPWVSGLLLAAWLAAFFRPPWRQAAAWVLLAVGALYILLAPLGVRERR